MTTTLITKLKGTKNITLKKPNWFKRFFILRTPRTIQSFFVFKNYDSKIRKETSEFIEKHKKAFESLSKK